MKAPRAFPKDAPIRQDKRLTNQPSLFDNPKIVPFGKLVEPIQKSYAWLLFNATDIGALTHVCWGMPEAEQDRFLAHYNILYRVLSLGLLEKVDVEKPSKPDPKQAMKFKKHIEERIERSSGGKDSKKG